MPTTVDELITIYKAVDEHTQIARGVAQVQMQVSKGFVDTTKARAAYERQAVRDNKVIESGLKVQAQAAKAGREEQKERESAARAIMAEARAHDALTRAQERQERTTRQLGAARRFANGFGSTRLNFGMASPLISSFTRGGVAGGLGALAATGLGAGMSGISSLISGAGNLLSSGISGGLGLLGSLASRAQEAAMQASSRQGRLTAILRDSAEAARVLKMVQAVAAPSTATTAQLAEAATTLEAFGVNANRSIPIIGKLATAMGAGEEQMQMYARAIGQLGSGHMIEADVMASMGLQRRDFAAQGIQFDGQGKLLSSAEQALTALEKIVNQRFGNIFEQMAKTPEAAKASLEDAGQRVLEIIGMGMSRGEGPIVEALTKNFNAMVDSGVLSEVVGRATGDIFKALNLGNQGDAITGIMARVLAFAEVVPGNLARGVAFVKDFTLAAINNVSEFFKMAEDRANRFMGRISLMIAQGSVLTQGIARALENPLGAAPLLADTFRTIGTMGSVGDMALGAGEYNPNYQSLPSLPAINGTNPGRIAEIEARLNRSMATPGGGIPDASGQAFLRRAQMPEDNPVKEHLAKIAEHTAKTAKNTDPSLNESIFGGKRGKGISYADVLGGGAGRGGGFTLKVDKAASDLERVLYAFWMENQERFIDYFMLRAGMRT